MEIKDYCKNMDMELTLWKAKLYDVMNKMDKLPTGRKQRMYEEVNGLHILMTELDDRVEALRKECPTEWGLAHSGITSKFEELGIKYNDTSKELFDYDFGG